MNYSDLVLERLAETSPKSYAAKIYRRNKNALKILDKMWEDYLEYKKRSPNLRPLESGLYPDGKMTEEGCPHCKHDECEECLWVRAYLHVNKVDIRDIDEDMEELCVRIDFNGVSMIDQSCIQYSNHCTYIRLPSSVEQYLKARKLLLGHMEWAKSKRWGIHVDQ